MPGRRDVRKILRKKNAKEENVLNLGLEKEHTEGRRETVAEEEANVRRYRSNL